MSEKILERAQLKATITDEQHVIEFYAAAFGGRPDKNGDVIAPYALDEWLDTFYKAGFPLAISFTHGAVRDSTDASKIVGYAPADVEHVFKDAHGLRVKAFLDTGSNEGAQQVYMLTKRGIVHGASIAYNVPAGGEKLQKDGSTLITKMSIIEAGPCLDPANDEAFVISVKNLLGAPVVDEELARLKHALKTMEVHMDEDSSPDAVPEPELALAPAVDEKAGKTVSNKTAAQIKQAMEHFEQGRGLLDELLALVEADTSASVEAKTNETAELRDPELGHSEPSPNADTLEALAAALR